MSNGPRELESGLDGALGCCVLPGLDDDVRERRTEKQERDVDMTQTVTLTDPQRLQALDRANKIRLARAGLKRRIADGELSAAQVILEPPDAAKKWSVADLLMSQRRWGAKRCRKFLGRNNISETKLVHALTDRQRRLLADQLQPPPSPEPADEMVLVA